MTHCLAPEPAAKPYEHSQQREEWQAANQRQWVRDRAGPGRAGDRPKRVTDCDKQHNVHLVLPAGNEIAERDEPPHHQHRAHAEDDERGKGAGLGEGGEEAHSGARRGLVGGLNLGHRSEDRLHGIEAGSVLEVAKAIDRLRSNLRALRDIGNIHALENVGEFLAGEHGIS